MSPNGGPLPSEQVPAPLNAPPPSPSVLTCVLCSIDPIFVDDKLEGRISVSINFTVATDGTVEAVQVSGISSAGLEKKIRDQIGQWLFEPPLQNGKPFQVSTKSTLNITVMRSK
jgi:hypothetical protein